MKMQQAICDSAATNKSMEPRSFCFNCVWHKWNNSFSASGQGYQNLATKVDYKIISSRLKPVPTAFLGTNPIHIQLESDPSVTKRFVQISLLKQIVVSGLSFETPENMALQSFSFSYVDRGIQFPASSKTFNKLFGEKQVCALKDDEFHTYANCFIPKMTKTWGGHW